LDKPVDPIRLVQFLDEVTGAHTVTKVLLVDDEEVSRYLVRQLLPRRAFYLHEAANAAEGLDLVRQENPDVIILDIDMKPIDGFTFLSLLSGGEAKRRAPVIVLTSLIPNDEQKGKLSAAAEIMSKSDLTTAALVTAIRRALEVREGHRP
jgi:CheY-like chemotaxis protein